MACCTGPCAAAVHFNPMKAERDLRRYQHHLPDPSTRILLAELRRSPLQGLPLLDVGGGIRVNAAGLPLQGPAIVHLRVAATHNLVTPRPHLASPDA